MNKEDKKQLLKGKIIIALSEELGHQPSEQEVEK